MKKTVTKFDLASAFKALDEIDAPVVSSKPRTSERRASLSESVRGIDMTSELLEDYYNVTDHSDLQQAQEDRAAEVAKAKLTRIEKIVDLNAETPEDVLPSYVGKTIVQCPQCMTLFYRNPDDLVATEDDPNTVNTGEVCPNCGHQDGYIVIGKVAAEDNTAEAPAEETPVEVPNAEAPVDELPEPDEVSTEDTAEEPAAEEPVEEPAAENSEESEASEEDKTAELEPVETEDEEEPEEEEEDEVHESLSHRGYPYTFNESAEGPLTEDAVDFVVEEGDDFDKAIKKWNDHVDTLRTMIKSDEAALKSENNDEIKGTIQKRLDAAKEDLNAALPDSIKSAANTKELPAADEIPDAAEEDTASSNAAELPTPEEAGATEEPKAEPKTESLTEADVGPETILQQMADVNDKQIQFYQDAIKQQEALLNSVNDDEKADLQAFIDELNTRLAAEQEKKKKAEDALKNLTESYVYCDKNIYRRRKKLTEAKNVVCKKYKVINHSEGEAKDLNEASTPENKFGNITSGEIKSLFNSAEFKTPISEEEVEGYFDDARAEADKAETVDEVTDESCNLATYDNLNESTFNEHLNKYFTEVYQNVKSYKATDCQLEPGKLIVEGILTFNSGKQKPTTFEFRPVKKGLLEGVNTGVTKDGKFALNYMNEDCGRTILTTGLSYRYSIDNNLVEGYTGRKDK